MTENSEFNNDQKSIKWNLSVHENLDVISCHQAPSMSPFHLSFVNGLSMRTRTYTRMCMHTYTLYRGATSLAVKSIETVTKRLLV
jgi:hypothetical protein